MKNNQLTIFDIHRDDLAKTRYELENSGRRLITATQSAGDVYTLFFERSEK